LSLPSFPSARKYEYPLLALADTLSDNRALSSLHVGRNGIPEKEMREIMAIAASKESMKMICEVSFKDKTITALDVSDKKLGVEGALVVAEYLDGNGAMTKFDISSNNIRAEGGKALAAVLKGNQVITELNISSNNLGYNLAGRRDTSFLIAIADTILDRGALHCVDGTLYQSEKSFMMSTHVCCHCGQHKTQHTSR
jgi:hypothetical protein